MTPVRIPRSQKPIYLGLRGSWEGISGYISLPDLLDIFFFFIVYMSLVFFFWVSDISVETTLQLTLVLIDGGTEN